MRTFIPFLLGVAVVVVMILAAAPNSEDRIYGKVTTDDGDVYEGFIRWDKNEASWVDVLDGTKRLDRSEHRTDGRRRTRKMRIFGFEFGAAARIISNTTATPRRKGINVRMTTRSV